MSSIATLIKQLLEYQHERATEVEFECACGKLNGCEESETVRAPVIFSADHAAAPSFFSLTNLPARKTAARAALAFLRKMGLRP